MNIKKLATSAANWQRKSGKSMPMAVDDVLKPYSLAPDEYQALRESILRECGRRGGRKSRGKTKTPRQLRLQFK